MSNWPNLKIDIWWKAVLILGVLAAIGAASFEIDFLERKHLFGLGLGMILIGLGFWKSWSKTAIMMNDGSLKTDLYKHDVISVVLLVLGVLMVGFFGFLIVKGLI